MSHAKKQKNLSRNPHRRKYLPQESSLQPSLFAATINDDKEFFEFSTRLFFANETFFHPIYSLSLFLLFFYQERTQTIYIYLSAKQKMKNEWKINKFLTTKMIKMNLRYLYILDKSQWIDIFLKNNCLPFKPQRKQIGKCYKKKLRLKISLQCWKLYSLCKTWTPVILIHSQVCVRVNDVTKIEFLVKIVCLN